MIYLITGLPGNGKTLYTLWTVKQRAEKEARAVFYSGIPDLALDTWTEFDNPEDWHTLPDGAIIVIDEAQRAFRPRPGRGGIPAHVEQLETHRHKGFDIYLITQHPTLIDNNVRRLAGNHSHVVRSFGLERAVIHEWGEVHLDCERNRADSSKTTWKYPKDIYGLYKSATVHTHKRQIPKQVWYLGIALAVLGLCAWLVVDGIAGAGMNKQLSPVETHVGDVPLPSIPAFPGNERQKKPMTLEEYVQHLTPRIEDLPHTAPRYDKVTEPVEAPVIAGCIENRDSCRCYSQRGTLMPASMEQCSSIVAYGVPFYDFQQVDGRSQAKEQPRPPQMQNVAVSTGFEAGEFNPVPLESPGVERRSWGGVAASDVWGGVR